MSFNTPRSHVPVFAITGALFTVAALAAADPQARAQESRASNSRATSRDGSRDGHARRNVVFILSDDHRYDFMGCAGGPEFLETPHMDRMAAGGQVAMKIGGHVAEGLRQDVGGDDIERRRPRHGQAAIAVAAANLDTTGDAVGGGVFGADLHGHRIIVDCQHATGPQPRHCHRQDAGPAAHIEGTADPPTFFESL